LSPLAISPRRRFCLTARRAVLHLLALFQSYDAATSLIEDRDLTEAAHEADHRASTWMKHWSRSRWVGNRAAALSSVEAMAS
jgi:hypothetical protein